MGKPIFKPLGQEIDGTETAPTTKQDRGRQYFYCDRIFAKQYKAIIKAAGRELLADATNQALKNYLIMYYSENLPEDKTQVIIHNHAEPSPEAIAKIRKDLLAELKQKEKPKRKQEELVQVSCRRCNYSKEQSLHSYMVDGSRFKCPKDGAKLTIRAPKPMKNTLSYNCMEHPQHVQIISTRDPIPICKECQREMLLLVDEAVSE